MALRTLNSPAGRGERETDRRNVVAEVEGDSARALAAFGVGRAGKQAGKGEKTGQPALASSSGGPLECGGRSERRTTGELLEIERLMSSSERGRGHSFIGLAVRKGKPIRSQYNAGHHATGPSV
jgi:hypothetical protein